MFSRFRAEWRRARARKFISVGENCTFECKSAVGPVVVHGRFEEEDKTLILIIRNIYARDVLEKGEYRAEPGLAAVRHVLRGIAQMAAELGYTRFRITGQRTKRHYKRGGRQQFEFDLARYLRDSEAAR